MNSIESFKHLSDVGESGARWLANGQRAPQIHARRVGKSEALRQLDPDGRLNMRRELRDGTRR